MLLCVDEFGIVIRKNKKEAEMSVLSHNLSPTILWRHNPTPTKWWHCSHRGVTCIDLFGALTASIALLFTESLYAQEYILVVVIQMCVSAAYH
ncbi:MAG: hypothetical protein ACI9SY_000553 [Candidatus Paceibacteria bacterium]|jgi:hypothetical protein